MRVFISGNQGLADCLPVAKLKDKTHLMAPERNESDIPHCHAVLNAVMAFQSNYITNIAACTAVDKAKGEFDLSCAINRDVPAFLAEVVRPGDATLLPVSTHAFDGRNRAMPAMA